MKTVMAVCLFIVLVVCLWLLALRSETAELRKMRGAPSVDLPTYTITI